jgi:GntR family transcriptional repressor for pyruvate dehydrogenase complex
MAASRHEVNRKTLTDQVADLIAGLIRERGLHAGDPLPATAELSESFNVSRPVVREAIAELAGRGLLRRHQGRESVVTVPGSDHLERLFSYRIEDAGISDEHLQEYRECVEVAAARLAARNATAEDDARLEQRVEAMRSARRRAELLDADVELHRAIAQAGRNELLILTLDAITPLLRSTRAKVWQGLLSAGIARTAIVDNHAEIVARIRERDEDGAAGAMDAHLRDARLALEARAKKRQRR